MAMCSHSKTLFRFDDGSSMNFAVLKSSFDAHIVCTLIQWGGGSVSITDEPVSGAINLSCKKLPMWDRDVFNTAFIYACCLSNRLLDHEGFCFGRSQSGKDPGRESVESRQSTLDSETRMSPYSIKESSQDMLRAWLLSQEDNLSCGDKEGMQEKKEDDSPSCLSDATTCSPDYGMELDDSEVLPEDSASAVRWNDTHSSSENAEVLMAHDDVSSEMQKTIELQVNKWLTYDSPDQCVD